VARIALEAGAGLEVVLGLTLGDWLDRGMGREIVARAVGRDRRVQLLRVAPLTARLLHQYGETARMQADPGGSRAGSRCQIRCDHEPVPCIKTRDRPAISGGRSARVLPAPINAWRICS